MKYILYYPLRLLWAIFWCFYISIIIVVATALTFIWHFKLDTDFRQFILHNIWIYPVNYSWDRNHKGYKSPIHWALKIK